MLVKKNRRFWIASLRQSGWPHSFERRRRPAGEIRDIKDKKGSFPE
jgi:hypothetical protein